MYIQAAKVSMRVVCSLPKLHASCTLIMNPNWVVSTLTGLSVSRLDLSRSYSSGSSR
uniref:Uncharacterized protein n=1 Tax=Arundo donax TaxID=35708 RepID=A0A0A9BSS6_ARUDO